MKLSVLDLVPVLGNASSVEAIGQALKLAQAVEHWGYERYWVAEHHDLPGLACASPEVLLAYIGAHTSRIRLGSGATLLPYYKPIKVAETFHMLATLFPRRMDLGIGRAPGGSAHVSMALSSNFLEHVWHLPDALRDLLKLLTNSYQIDEHKVTARPVPPQPPDVWLLGTNDKSAAYAAEFGTGYVFGQFMSDRNAIEVITTYREQFIPSSLTKEPRVIVAVGIICADTEEEARLLAGEITLWLKPERAVHGDRDEILLAEQRIWIGTPDQIKARLEAFQIKAGIDEFLIVTMVADYDKRLRSYELLANAFDKISAPLNNA
jgi:luciferase family oxidoreductase group 1